MSWDIRSQDYRVLATLDGALDATTTAPLGEWLSPIAKAGNHLVLNLARISFCSTAGLNLFVQLHHQTETAGGSLQLATPSATLRRMLNQTRLDTVLTTTPNSTSDMVVGDQ